MSYKNSIQNLFISMVEKVANGKLNVLDFGEEDMVFYRGEIHILKKIGDYEGIYSSELAEYLGVTRAVIHKTLLKLSQRNLIYKVEDENDRKRKKLYLTEKGKRAYEFHERYHRESDAEFIGFLEHLNEEEYKIIYEFLIEAKKLVDKHF